MAKVNASDYHLISIHALREEGDQQFGTMIPIEYIISIHALREEGDLLPIDTNIRARNFYPRPPRGGRLERR